MATEEEVLADIIGGGQPDAKAAEPAAQTEVEREPEPRAKAGETAAEPEPEAKPEPEAEQPHLFFLKPEDLDGLDPNSPVYQKVAAADKEMHNRYSRMRQKEAEELRAEKEALREEREKLTEKFMDFSLQNLRKDDPAIQPGGKTPPAYVQRLKELGFEDGAIEAIGMAAEEIASGMVAPIREQTEKTNLQNQAISALEAFRQSHGDATALEPVMQKMVNERKDVQAVLQNLPDPKTRLDYLYALASVEAAKNGGSKDAVRVEAEKLVKEQAALRNAAPAKGGAAGAPGRKPDKAPMDSFVDEIFTGGHKYG